MQRGDRWQELALVRGPARADDERWTIRLQRPKQNASAIRPARASDDLVEARVTGDADRRRATSELDEAAGVVGTDCTDGIKRRLGVPEDEIRDATTPRGTGRERGAQESERD